MKDLTCACGKITPDIDLSNAPRIKIARVELPLTNYSLYKPPVFCSQCGSGLNPDGIQAEIAAVSVANELSSGNWIDAYHSIIAGVAAAHTLKIKEEKEGKIEIDSLMLTLSTHVFMGDIYSCMQKKFGSKKPKDLYANFASKIVTKDDVPVVTAQFTETSYNVLKVVEPRSFYDMYFVGTMMILADVFGNPFESLSKDLPSQDIRFLLKLYSKFMCYLEYLHLIYSGEWKH